MARHRGVDHLIRLWNLADGKPGPVLEGHTAAITAVAFSPDQSKLVAAADKTLRLWPVAGGDTCLGPPASRSSRAGRESQGDLVAAAQAGDRSSCGRFQERTSPR
ncbi:MAG: hypothetical protein U0903_01170 [Planctomycetales bacterium]